MKMGKNSKETEWDELYAAPLDGFVARRDELVGELKKAGQEERAQALAKARRPPLTAWAANQAVRADPGALEELLSAAAAARESQDALLAGGDAEEFRRQSERLHAAVRSLVQTAGKIASEAGHPTSASFLGRVERSFFAGATGEGEAREQLASGRLTRDLAPSDALTQVEQLKPRARAPATGKPQASIQPVPRADHREA
jgi:hypothetical protein